ncbi:MAG: hypothetical protein RXQ77_02880 [Candidatus Nanopusillus sp.]|jgi:hypothetical protein
MGSIIIEITMPVIPTGRKFIRHIYAGVGSSVPEIIKYFKSELSRLSVELGLKISDVIGNGKYIKGKIILEYDDNTKRPLKLLTKEIEIFDTGRPYVYPIIVENHH